jgi:pimeloyl-ACP methyl ester carboxylesterase
VAESVCELVARTTGELDLQPGRTITAGSSMGGWAALYFAARTGAGHAIAGEPQTLLGSYLCGGVFGSFAEHIAGGDSEEDREFLDGLLFDALRANPAPLHIDLYCGRGSPYYAGHVTPLVALLDELEVPWELELGEYTEHDDLVHRFPAYLVERAQAALAELRHSGTR